MNVVKKAVSWLLLAALLLSGSGCTASPSARALSDQAKPMEVSAASQQNAGAAPRVISVNLLNDENVAVPTVQKNAADVGFAMKFEGNRVAGTAEVVDGAYRVVATKTDGEAWHIKLECNYPTTPGHDYRVTYRFRSDVEGLVKFGDFQEFRIVRGENTVTGQLVATGGTSYLDLQLGALSPFTVEFTGIHVEELTDEAVYEDALAAPIAYTSAGSVFEQHDDGYTTEIVRDEAGVTLRITKVPSGAEVWKTRLYVKTGMTPAANTRYRVSADLTSDADTDFEICYNNGDTEKGYGALYGQHLAAGETKTFEQVISTSADFSGGELVLQFALGKVPENASITVGGVRVETIQDQYQDVLPIGFALDDSVDLGSVKKTVPSSYKKVQTSFSYTGTNTIYERHDDDYTVSLEKGGSSATLKITQAPADRGVWKAKLYAATGVTLETGKTYRIKFKLKATDSQGEYEACFDGNTENAYGALYGRSLAAGGTDEVEYIVTPAESRGKLTLRLQLGKTDSTAGNSFTLSDLSVEEMTATATSIGNISYTTGTNVSEVHWDGVEQTVSASGSTATLNVSAARSGGGLWSSQLLIHTGFTPEAGARYRVTATVASDKAFNDMEMICENIGGESYGGLFGQSLPGGPYSLTFTAPGSGCGELRLRFQVGNSPANNTITVSNIQIVKLETTETAVALSNFAYPVTSDPTVTQVAAGYVAQNINVNAYEAHDDGYTQSVNGMALTVSAVPGPNLGVWQSKLFVDTGTALQAGEQYRVVTSITATKATEFEICYNNGNTEKGYGALYGRSIAAGETKSYDTDFTVAGDATTSNLVLQLMLGKTPAENTITVNSVRVYRVTDASVNPYQYEEVQLAALSASEGHDEGYTQSVSGTALTVSAVPTMQNGVWQSKLFVNTGVALEAGAKYKVSAKVTSAKAMGFEICYNNGDAEKGYEALYGQTVAAGETKTCVKEFEVAADAVTNNLVLQFQLGTTPAGNTITVSDVTLEKWVPEHDETTGGSTTKNDFDVETNGGADAALSGNGSSATVLVNTSTGDDWHIKFYAKPHVTLENGKTYKISFQVSGASGCSAFYKRLGGDEDSFGTESITSGEQTVTHIVAPEESGELEIMLKVGTVASGNRVAVSNVRIAELEETESANLMTASLRAWAPVNFWAHEDYAATVSNSGSSAGLTIQNAPANKEVWKVKLFTETGVALTAGKSYRISADVRATSDIGYEICYNNGAVEKGVGALYGLTATSAANTVVYDVTPENDATLILQFSLGNAAAGTTVTVSNIKVEELSLTAGENLLSNFSFNSTGYIGNASDGGYVTELSQNSTSVTMKISEAPAERNPWNVKLNIRTGFTPQKRKSYRVRFDIEGTKAQDLVEVFYDGTAEAAYGALYNQSLSTGKKTLSYTVKGDGTKGELTLQVRLGKTNGTDGNIVTVSNIVIEEITYKTVEQEQSNAVSSVWAHDDYGATITATEKSAVVRLEKAPASGREAWKVKTFIDTGVTLKAGQKYRISLDVSAEADAPYEICLNRDGVEKGLGALYNLTATKAAQRIEFTAYAAVDTHLIIQVSLGNCAAPNTITVSNVQVNEAGALQVVSDTEYGF